MKKIHIFETGDASVGIQGQTIATLQIEDEYITPILEEEDGLSNLNEFEKKLAQLVEQYFGADTKIDVEDDITPTPDWY
jgi:hypothetical protein